ncbi:M42 family metallopeptidase [Hujiaoplasma nucleasis]|uniref:M42 family metallopeptidase n=1 Tax=Hujiaoplasma nucleasis TaxID=2725268 RepID=A0A7L6N0E7_9MOLU|nr:M42 family metallopeptidase [Hujiaoplasma nucleasis]QLY39726.1 M42 family metallopeptidase [Hujiaoplasma nucleasis]
MDKNISYILDFAKKILNIPSPSGYTHKVIEAIEEESNKLGLTSYKTKKGNLIIDVLGTSDQTLGLSAHVDTLGAMVRSISSDGNLKFTTIGGPIWPTLDGEYCTVHTREGKDISGTFLSNSPSSHVFKNASSETRNPDNMFVRIDEVVKNKEDVEKLGIRPGDFIFFDPKTTITQSGYIKSRFLDDKISVAIIFGFLKYLKDHQIKPKQNLKIIISTYEEVGHGASFIPDLDEMIAVDMGCIGEDLSCTEHDVSICAKDSSGPYDYHIISKLVDISKKEKLNYVTDIYPFYGSDVSAAYRGGKDFRGGLIGPGVHASHGMERTHIDAIDATFKLLINYVQ